MRTIKLYKYSVLFLLLCIGLNSCKKGANETIVYGTVFEMSNPVAGVQVTLTIDEALNNTRAIGSAVTGMDGTYEMVIPDETFKYADESHGREKYHHSISGHIIVKNENIWQAVIIYRDSKNQIDLIVD